MTDRTFRIFISSTFADLQAERDRLRETVWPVLERLCERHGTRFQAIDLRWGVTDEAALDQGAMDICLEELRRSQDLSPRPNFVVLLGERYGWRPLPRRLAADRFEELLAALGRREGAAGQTELLRSWYRRDDNAVPPIYQLVPRAGDAADPNRWQDIERDLRQALLAAADGVELPIAERASLDMSATEQEISHGLLEVAGAEDHVFAFLRDLANPAHPSVPPGFLDRCPDGSVDEAARLRVEALRDRLRQRLPGHVIEYHPEWTDNGLSPAYLDRLCHDVEACLRGVIERELALEPEASSDRGERRAHQAFATARARNFVGRSGLLEGIQQYLLEGRGHPAVVLGESGMGKTSVMACAVARFRERNPSAVVVERYVGATPRSTNLRELLEGIIHEVATEFGVAAPPPSVNLSSLVEGFHACLRHGTARQRLVLVIDALDQLDPSEEARDLLWLPEVLPDHVGLVVSAQPALYRASLQDRVSPACPFTLASLSGQDGEILLETRLAEAGRTLQPGQRRSLLARFADDGSPLHLRLLADEACHWPSWRPDTEEPAGADARKAIRRFFDHLVARRHHGSQLVAHSLGLLAAARNGLAESELLTVLSDDDEVMEELRSGSRCSPRCTGVPFVVWARLRSDLSNYLVERQSDGTVLLSFFHQAFADVATERFLGEEDGLRRHAGLARTFRGRTDFQDEARREPDRRKASEAVFQSLRAGEAADAARLLQTRSFAEAVCLAMGPSELASQFETVAKRLPDGSESRLVLDLLSRAVWMEHQFLSRHPDHLVQALVNRARWHDDAAAAGHYQDESGSPASPGSLGAGSPVRDLLEGWSREFLEQGTRPLVRQIIPPPEHLDASGTPSVLGGHAGWVEGLAVSPDGRFLATADSRAELRLWRLPGGDLVRVVHERHDDFQGLAFVRRGTELVTLAKCGLVARRRAATLEVIEEWKVGERCDALAASEDGLLVAVGCRDGSVRLFRDHVPEPLVLKLHDSDVYALALDAVGGRVVSGSADGTVRVLDLASGNVVLTFDGHRDTIIAVACSPDGALVASASVNRGMHLWDARSGLILWSKESSSHHYQGLAFHPRGHQIALGRGDGKVEIREVGSGAGKRVGLLEGHRDAIRRLAFLPGDAGLVTASLDQDVRIWRPDGPQRRVLRLVEHKTRVAQMRFSGDGSLLATAASNYPVEIHVRNVDTGRLDRVLSCPNADVEALAVGPDNRHLAAADNCGSLRIWSLPDGTLLHELSPDQRRIHALDFDPTGRTLLSRGAAHSALLWDVAGGRLRATGCIDSPAEPAWAFSADGDHWLTANTGGISVQDTRTGEERVRIPPRHGLPSVLALIPDGRVLASGTTEGFLLLHDLETGELLEEHPCFPNGLDGLAGSPDGRWVAAGCGHRAGVRLLDVESGVLGPAWPGIVEPDGIDARSRELRDLMDGGEKDMAAALARLSSKMGKVAGDSPSRWSDPLRRAQVGFSRDGRVVVLRLIPGGNTCFRTSNGSVVERIASSGVWGNVFGGPYEAPFLLDTHSLETRLLDRRGGGKTFHSETFDKVVFSPADPHVFAGRYQNRVSILRVQDAR